MPVQHLLQIVETHQSTRPERDTRPSWLTGFIDAAADVFEPFSGMGRVGFDCRFSEDCWTVGLYLGGTEIVGGKDDGRTQHADYEFDLKQCLDYFTEVEEICWNVFPGVADDGDGRPDPSFLAIRGRVDENPLQLKIYSRPPAGASPGLRQYPDGRQEPV